MTFEEFLKTHDVEMTRDWKKWEEMTETLDEKVLYTLMQYAYEVAYMYWERQRESRTFGYNMHTFMETFTKKDAIYALLMAAKEMKWGGDENG